MSHSTIHTQYTSQSITVHLPAKYAFSVHRPARHSSQILMPSERVCSARASPPLRRPCSVRRNATRPLHNVSDRHSVRPRRQHGHPARRRTLQCLHAQRPSRPALVRAAHPPPKCLLQCTAPLHHYFNSHACTTAHHFNGHACATAHNFDAHAGATACARAHARTRCRGSLLG